MKRAQIRRKLSAGKPKKTKSLPKGNLKAQGNEGGRRQREQRPINGQVLMGDGQGGIAYSMPVSGGTSVTAEKQAMGKRPGTGRPGIPWHLPPEGPPIKL